MRFVLILAVILLTNIYTVSAFAYVCANPPPFAANGLTGQVYRFYDKRNGQPYPYWDAYVSYMGTAPTIGTSTPCFSADEQLPTYDGSHYVFFPATGSLDTSCGLAGYAHGAYRSVGATPATSANCPVTCTSFTYSDWSSCINDSQSRTVLTSSPAGCVGGSPVLTQACVSVPSHCSDSDKSGDEVGIDCGGSCPSACVDKCPAGSAPQSSFPNLAPVYNLGFYGGDPYEANSFPCVKVELTNNPFNCPMSTVSYTNESGQLVTGCMDVYNTIKAKDETTTVAIDAYFVDLPPGEAIPANAPESLFSPPAATENTSTTNTKTFADGTVCTYTTDENGLKTMKCIGPDGNQQTMSEPTPQLALDETGCRSVTYASGTTCTVCIVNGIQEINCVDSQNQPVSSSNYSSTTTNNNYSTASADASAQLALTQQTNQKLNYTNDLLRQLNNKSTNVTAEVDLGPVTNRLDTVNLNLGTVSGKLTDINTTLNKPKADNHDSELAALNTLGDSALTEYEATLNAAKQQIVNDYDPDAFPVSEPISNLVTSVIPQPTTCQDITVTLGGHAATIQCEPFEEFKRLFSWLLYVWTVFYIWETLMETSPKK